MVQAEGSRSPRIPSGKRGRFPFGPLGLEIGCLPFATLAGAVIIALLGVSTVPLVELLYHSPSVVVWTIIGIVIAGTFTTGALLTRVAVRRDQQLVRAVEYSERRLAEARRELAEVETAIADRVVSYYEPVPFVNGMENPAENFRNIAGWLVKHGYSDGDIQKVIGGNIMRLLSAAWKSTGRRDYGDEISAVL